MTPEERERLIVDMLEWSRGWDDQPGRPEFPLSVVQRMALLTPEEYASLWAEYEVREMEDMEEGYPPMVVQYDSNQQDGEAIRLAQEFVENQRHGVGLLQPMNFPTSVMPHITLSTETEAILGRLLNPTTMLERLCVAAMRGDAVALAALADGIKQGDLTL